MVKKKNRKSRSGKNRTSRKPRGNLDCVGEAFGVGADTEHDLPDPRSMEAVMSRIAGTAFPSARGDAVASDVDGLALLSRAQDVMYDAWEAGNRRERIALAKKPSPSRISARTLGWFLRRKPRI